MTPTTVFSPDELKAIADKALLTVPVEHTNALVGGLDQNGAQVVLSFKSHDQKWTATGVARHEWTGANEVGASLIYSW